MEKEMTIKQAWRYCYAAARQAARHYQNGLYYAETGRIDSAAYYFMLASNAVQDANTGYRSTGSIYTTNTVHGFIFNAYTHDSDRLSKCHTFKFRFGETTPENKAANDNRRQWQKQAQSVERIAELRRAKLDIARTLNAMNDEEFFIAYKLIKASIKSTR